MNLSVSSLFPRTKILCCNKVKYEVRTYELEFAVEGDFVIEIVNNRPNGLTGNKDRATIWNIEWVSAK